MSPNGTDFEVKEEYKKYYTALVNFHRWLERDISELVKVGGYSLNIEMKKYVLYKLKEIEEDSGVEIR